MRKRELEAKIHEVRGTLRDRDAELIDLRKAYGDLEHSKRELKAKIYEVEHSLALEKKNHGRTEEERFQLQEKIDAIVRYLTED